jgi:UTP--glucose-1-phosphate uridylyltransferase
MSVLLREALEQLAPSVTAELQANGFDSERFCALATKVSDAAGKTRETDKTSNRVKGRVEPIPDGDIPALPDAQSAEGKRLASVGLEALQKGQCALLLLAGGMATRMGGVVKALVEACDGKTFLELRLAEIRALAAKAGAAPPLWLMTSRATDEAIKESLGDRLDGYSVATFRQLCFPRLTREGDLFHGESGEPSLYAPGHGDVPDCLRASGLLDRFLRRDGKIVMVANIDNLGATLDPLVIGWHVEHGTDVTCEVVNKVGADRGGIPVLHDGRPTVLEEFRLPEDFDASRVRVFNSNTFHFNAQALNDLDFEWTYFVVEKTVGAAKAIQLERLIGEVTSHLDTRFLLVPREGAAARFLPVKDRAELERRQGEILEVLRSRGVIE